MKNINAATTARACLGLLSGAAHSVEWSDLVHSAGAKIVNARDVAAFGDIDRIR